MLSFGNSITILPVGSCVLEVGGDPATGEVEDVFGPPDRVGTELFGSLLVFVTGEHAVESALYKSEVLRKDNPTVICKGTFRAVLVLLEEPKESSLEDFVHGNATRCREIAIEGETTNVTCCLAGVCLPDGAK